MPKYSKADYLEGDSVQAKLMKPKIGIGNRDNKMAKRLQFEMLLSDLSASFVSLSGAQIDKAIETGLQRIVNFIGFDRASLTQIQENGQYQVTHNRVRDDTFKIASPYVSSDFLPLITEHTKKNKKIICLPNLEDAPPEIKKDMGFLQKKGVKSIIIVPLFAGDINLGFLSSGAYLQEKQITKELVNRFRLVGEIFANALIRKKNEAKLNRAFIEIQNLKDQLAGECTYLREEINLNNNFRHIIGRSQPINQVLQQIEQVAKTDATVLIYGETGTGKELIARSLHDVSLRNDRPLIKVDCTSLHANLIENELFGHEKSAFTGAIEKKIGRLELADKGTVFLDEISELPLELQSKLLRAIQDNEFERLGGNQTMKVNVRFIVATNKDLEKEVKKGSFREDLWYRLNVFPIYIPPLRERKDDIPLLAEWIIRQSNKKLRKSISKISNFTLDILQEYSWPGNIRELENVITRAVITSPSDTLQPESFQELRNTHLTSNDPSKTMAEMEYEHILKTLIKTKWKIQGPGGAACLLAMKPATLRDRMKKRGIKRPEIS